MGRERGELARIARLARVLERALEVLRPLAPTAGVDMNLALQPPGLGEPEIVAELLEQRDDLVGDVDDLLDRALGPREGAEELALDQRAELEPPVARCLRGLERIVEEALGPREVACAHERATEDRKDLPSLLVGIGQKRRRPGEEGDGGREIARVLLLAARRGASRSPAWAASDSSAAPSSCR